ncbi:hypothetical protein TSYNTROOL_20190 [Tepidanaerobacter syntrophicus]|nr:hypothetical protein TSYNTROOL_20190 [Tepidanaerobacter syntrophicus]
MKLVIATKNKGKFLEFQRMLEDIPVKLMSLEDFPEIEITEDGATFEENALLKAKITCTKTGMPALGDDSGLRVQALSGKVRGFLPGMRGKGPLTKIILKNSLTNLRMYLSKKGKLNLYACWLLCCLMEGPLLRKESWKDT